MNEEQRLKEKLRRIEALFAGTDVDGERAAAASALERLRQRLKDVTDLDPPVEYTFSLHSPWSRNLFRALLRRYGIQPYRYYRQRRTTIKAKAPASFVEETLWPQFQELDKTLSEYLSEITSRVIRESIFEDFSEGKMTDTSLPEPSRG
jgi:hypothetical protein